MLSKKWGIRLLIGAVVLVVILGFMGWWNSWDVWYSRQSDFNQYYADQLVELYNKAKAIEVDSWVEAADTTDNTIHDQFVDTAKGCAEIRKEIMDELKKIGFKGNVIG